MQTMAITPWRQQHLWVQRGSKSPNSLFRENSLYIWFSFDFLFYFSRFRVESFSKTMHEHKSQLSSHNSWNFFARLLTLHCLLFNQKAPKWDAVACVSVPRLRFFFFFLGFAPTRLDSRQIGFDLSRTRLIRLESGHIGHIGSYRLATDTAETGLKRPKQAEISLETRRNSRNFDLRGVSCLLLSLFCESRHSNVFFKNILIVKIYRKYK